MPLTANITQHCKDGNNVQGNINPFDTEPMTKIAVKISIMRVVKFMSSPANDFTS